MAVLRSSGWALGALSLAAVAFALRSWTAGLILDPNFAYGRDGGTTLVVALQPVDVVLWLQAHDVHPFVYPLLLHGWLNAVGLEPFAARMLSVVAVPVAVAATYALGRQLASPAVGAGAALVMAASVPLVIATDNVRHYALSVALAALALAAIVALLRPRQLAQPAERILAAVWMAATLAGLFTSYFVAAVVVGHLAAIVWMPGERRRQLWIVGYTTMALPFLWWVGLVAANAATAPPGDIPIADRLAPLEPLVFASEALRQWLLNPFAPEPWWSGAVALIVAAIGCAGLRLLPGRRDPAAPVLGGGVVVCGGTLAAAATIAFVMVRFDLDVAPWRLMLVALPAWAALVAVVGFALADRRAAGALLLPAVAAATSLLSLPAYLALPQQDLEQWDPLGVAAEVAGRARADDLVVFTYAEQAAYYAWRQRGRSPDWVWTRARAFAFLPDMTLRTAALLDQTAPGHPAAWYVSPAGEPLADAPVRFWLRVRGFPADASFRAGTEIAAYAINVAPLRALSVTAAFADGLELTAARASAAAVPGGSAGVELEWRTTGPTSEALTVFVHLVDGSGRRLAGHDGPPADGQRPTTSWTAGETVVDRHGLLIPDDLAPGEYLLLAGLYGARGRLPLADGSTAVTLGTLTIRP